MKNAKKAPRKVSQIMRLMNFMLYTVFAFQITIIVVFSSLSLWWTTENNNLLEKFSLSTEVNFKSWII